MRSFSERSPLNSGRSVILPAVLTAACVLSATAAVAETGRSDEVFFRSGVVVERTGAPGPASLVGGFLHGFYTRFISPVDNRQCIFHPTCSEYARQAVSRHGVVVGVPLSAARLIRCNPSAFSSGNYPAAKTREDRWRADDPLD